MILSFSKTRLQFEAGIKTCTRRLWADHQFEAWCRQWDKGNLVHDAWSNLPFVPGAEKIGRFRLTCRPYWEMLSDMPESDLACEGGMCSTKEEFYRLIDAPPSKVVAVVRFERMRDARSKNSSI